MELDLAEATAENPDGQCADGEGPQNAIDGRTSTRRGEALVLLWGWVRFRIGFRLGLGLGLCFGLGCFGVRLAFG